MNPRIASCRRLLAVLTLPILCGCGASEAGSATQPAVPGAELSGLYFKMTFAFGSSQQQHFVFTSSGKYYEDVPTGGLEGFDIDKAIAEYPKSGGTYAVRNGELVMKPAQGAESKIKFERDAEGVKLDGILLTKVDTFKAGDTLDGSYSWGATVGGGTGAVVSAGVGYKFKKDGTFTSDRIAGTVISGGGETHTAKSEGATNGTYTLKGNTVELKHANGTMTRHCIYPYDMGKSIWINIDGNMCKPQ